MANTVKVKLNRGIVLQGIPEPRFNERKNGDPRKYGKTGDTVSLDLWLAHNLCAGEYPVAEFVPAK